jgi:cytochrome P450
MTISYSHVEHARDFEPTESYAILREQCPLHHEQHHDPPFYVLSRLDDVRDALKHPAQWTNRDGSGVFYQHDGVLGTADDPDHARQRKTLRDAFLPVAIARLEPRIAAIAGALFDEFVPLGEGDFVELFASPFPALVIGELLGVRAEDRDDFRRWSGATVEALTGGDLDRYHWAKNALGDHVDAMLEEREALLDGVDLDPGLDPVGSVLPDDVCSTMLIARRAGLLSPAEARHMGYQLLVAGHETTTSLLGLMLYRLIEHPDVMARLRAEPVLLGPAIEEALRYDSPVHGLFRTNAEPCVLHGEVVASRSKVQLLYASANRDPAHFQDPDEFRLDRDPHELGHHLALHRRSARPARDPLGLRAGPAADG